MYTKYIITVLLALFLCNTGAEAKRRSHTERIYIFGMAASFTDTIVHFTTIQEIQDAWVDQKTGFLLEREEYSYQLRNYLADQLLMPQRTCIVVYDRKLKKAEKKYERMLRLYTHPDKGARQYDLRYIAQENFNFHSIDMSAALDEEQMEIEEQKAAKKSPKKEKEKKKKKQKEDKLDLRSVSPPAEDEGRRPPRDE